MDKVRRRKSAADRKAEIVDTVIDLSAKLGPDRVTTQHLADQVGVTQPAIFRHFATKAEIWDAVSLRIVELLTPGNVGDGDPEGETIKGHVTKFLGLVAEFPSLPTILHSHELQVENDTVRARFAQLLDAHHTRIARLIKAGQDAGVHRMDVAAHSAAEIIMTALHGLCLKWALTSRSFNLVEAGENLLDSYLETLKPH